ncbi:MAG: hypothetical protein ABI780_10100, partial [Ardenticatenales bacterium]
TPVRMTPQVLLLVAALWAGTTAWGLYWHPQRGFWPAVLIGFVTTVLLTLADFGHALAHIFSARYAGAPMDEIRVTATQMPHTLYANNAVAPNVHRLRAVGGPLFNAAMLALSAAVWAVGPPNSIVRELATWSAAAHGMMMIMSLAPVPVVDGGTLLKWTLVARSWPEARAEATAKRFGWLAGIASVLIGLGLIALRVKLVGGVFALAGVIVLATAVGVIQ